MKKIIKLTILLLFTGITQAQHKTKTMDKKYGEGGYKLEYRITNVNGDGEDHVEYYDKDDKLQERETKTDKDYGNTVTTTTTFDCNGGQHSQKVIKKDKEGRIYEESFEVYDEKTKEVVAGHKSEYVDGVKKFYIFDDEEGEWYESKLEGVYLKVSIAIEKKKPVCCSPIHEVFLGYSFLSPTGEDQESIPLGAHLAYAYLLTQSIGLVADMSIHTKKESDLRIMRAFLMGGLQYNLVKEREKKLLACIRLLVGLASESQKYSSGEYSNTNKASALAIAAGMGLGLPIQRKLAVFLLADYIHTRFNDDGQGNIRVSAGLKINIGCK